MTALFIEGRRPPYAPDGRGGLILFGEFSRTVAPSCEDCAARLELRLCSDELLTDDECDQRLSQHLLQRGWAIRPDRCPACALTAARADQMCLDFGAPA